ncbi:MAG: TonB C-terminal domain-containing protein [Candidatus Acidiferrum sp.]
MSTAANPVDRLPPPLFQSGLGFRKFLVYSLILHTLLVVSIAASIYFQLTGPQWGGIGGTQGSVKVTLVSGPPPGIPMITKPTITDSKAVDETKGLWRETPKPEPKPAEPKTPAEAIPVFKHEKPLPQSHKSKVDESKIIPPVNAVDYGKGGPPQIPTSFATQPASGSGPVAVNGQGGGDFASRYAWYVEAVRRRISQNWLQSTIDPAIRAARTAHCVMTFRVYRDGTVKEMRLTQTSGNLSMDNSAQRALLSSNPMPPLPSDYSGSFVDVTFDFDLSLNQ